MLEQGTQQWLELRKGKITASKIPIIMGASPYRTAYQLWQEELGLIPPQESLPHMRAGNEIEQEARNYFYMSTGVEIKPDVLFHPEQPLFMASLDGVGADGRILCEIKKNNKDTHALAVEGKVRDDHMMQMQWQLYLAQACNKLKCVQGPELCHYLSYRGAESAIVLVPYDENLVKTLVESAHVFLRCLTEKTPPFLSERDYIDMSGNELLNDTVQSLEFYRDRLKDIQDNIEHCEKLILGLTKEQNAKGANWKVSKTVRKGNVDYKAIPELQSVNLEAYRKEPSTYFRITIDKASGD